MSISDVNNILEVFHSKDWSSKYEYHYENWKHNIWFKIGDLSEFKFVKDLINLDLKKINEEYEVSDWVTFLIYKEGDFFGLHTDDVINYGTSKKQIIYTGGYLLNNNFTGGDFIIDGKTNTSNVGELFLFERHLKHEVLKVNSGIRYSLHFAVEIFNKQIKKSII